MSVAQQRKEEVMAKVGSTTVHLTAYIFLRDSVSCAKQLLLLILPPLSHFRHGIIPSQHSVFCFFCVFFFFHASQYFHFFFTLYSITIYLFSPAINRTLAVTRLLSLLSLSSHVYLILVCKLSWEDCSTLQCKA